MLTGGCNAREFRIQIIAHTAERLQHFLFRMTTKDNVAMGKLY